MASVQIYRIEFITSHPSTSFVAGDVLDVFLETDDATVPAHPLSFIYSGLSVNLNGVSYPQLGSSGFLLLTRGVDFLISSYDPQVCVDGSLLVFSVYQPSWPYATYHSLENHYSCSINPPTCDLIITGIPSVTPATDETTADGSIVVTATSTNTIQYKIGSDFAYNDGTGQSSGTFSGLLPSNYRIFLRDSANCGANILVTVPFDNSYGPKFRLEYTDNEARPTRIDVSKRGYVGSVSEVVAEETPFTMSMRGEGSTDRFEPILALDATLMLKSMTDGQFAELYTNDPNLYRIEYYKDLGSGLAIQAIFKVLPQQYIEEYKATPYPVSVIGSCGLPELKEFYLVQPDGQKYYGTAKLIKQIAACLSVLKLDLPIRVAANMYATGMNTTASDDPLDQAHFDYEAFYLAMNEPTLDAVLRYILEPFGARIVQAEGRWNIVRVEEMTAAYDYRDFDKNGDYTGNGSFNPVVDINYPDNGGPLLLSKDDHSLESMPGYGKLKVNYHLGLKPNILENGDFRLKSIYFNNTYVFQINKDGWTLVNVGYVIQEGIEYIDDNNVAYSITSDADTMIVANNGGEAYLQSGTYAVSMGTNNQIKISLRCKVDRQYRVFGSTVYTIEVPYVKVRMRVKYGSLYLQSNGTWSSTENKVTFFLTEWNKYTEFEVIAQQPTSGTPTTGMDLDIRVYHAYAFHADFLDVDDLKALATESGGDYIVPNGYKTQLRDGGFIYYLELEDTTDAENLSDFSIVEPDDYNLTTNPRKWVMKTKQIVGGILGTTTFPFYIDKVVAQFLTGGESPIDTIVRQANGEASNRDTFEKDLYLGSFSNLIVTERSFGISLGAFFPGSTGLSITSTNILSAKLIYTGYLRDSTGVGYELWSRDGVAESDKLHGIWLKMYAKQYKRSWRLFRGSFYAEGQYFTFLNVARNVNDNNRVYLPIGLTLDDKMCTYSGEMHELIPEYDDSDGTGSSPYTSAFSSGFGSGGFN